jgi:hypothetical protein
MLEEHPKAIATETFYNTPEEVAAAVNAAYFPVQANEFNSYYTLLESCADNIFGKGSLAAIEEYAGYSAANITNMGGVWTQLYLAIRNANLVIKNVPKGSGTSDLQKAQFIGEARFVRAFCYFQLVRLWAGVPIRTEDNMDLIDLKRASVDEVYQLILGDLAYAEENLPDNPRMLGCASKWVAKTLLADVYLTREGWPEARDKAQEVIASGKFSLVNVNTPDDFEKIFGADVVTTPEEIFYFKYNDQYGWSIMSFFHISGDGYKPAGANYFAFYTFTDNPFYTSWDDGDFRKQHDFYPWDIGLGSNTLLTKKFIDPMGTTGASNDWPIYRYPEVLLIYAEAANRANHGPTAQAMECLNKVHRRAYGYDPGQPSPVDFSAADYDEASFFDLTLREKSYETILECKRWLDLVRTGNAAKMVKLNTGKTLNESMLLWPIPESEMNYNKAIDPVKDQNPGY